jgi:hypothetical protein
MLPLKGCSVADLDLGFKNVAFQTLDTDPGYRYVFSWIPDPQPKFLRAQILFCIC